MFLKRKGWHNKNVAAIKKCKTRLLLAVIDALVDLKSEFFDDSEHLKRTRPAVPSRLQA